MRKYYISLLVVTCILILASFIIMWTMPQYFIIGMPLLALYFAVVTGLEHYLIIKSAQKDPRTSVRNFLGISVGTMMMHLILIIVCMFRFISVAKLIAISFLIGCGTYLIFETIALIIMVKRIQNH